jgi:hypothetical protein
MNPLHIFPIGVPISEPDIRKALNIPGDLGPTHVGWRSGRLLHRSRAKGDWARIHRGSRGRGNPSIWMRLR